MDIIIVLIGACFGAVIGRLMALTVHYLPQSLLEGSNKPAPFEGKSFLLEGAVALLFGVSFLFFPINLALLFVLFISCILICCFITDYQHGILPNQFTLTLMWAGLIASLIPIFATPQEAIIGAASGYGVFWLLNAVYRLFTGRDGMYPGDFKLNAGIGACVGYKLLVPIIIISCFLLVIVNILYALFKRIKIGKNFIHKEIPYACFASEVTLVATYLMLWR